ncbi:hypothetical protein [Sphingobacterium sp. LRF_L2]|uniref:hypothetical protein n=1 Tax=Sphingobacterium sp. LRF_L2 TaxID=3369421 RepID=UPI003F5FA8FC
MEYRTQIIKTLKSLVHTRNLLFGNVLNIATAGELRDIMDAFEEGDSYDFQLEHVADLKDPNIKKLVHLIKQVEELYEEIKDTNNILSEELEEQETGEDSDNTDEWQGELPF